MFHDDDERAIATFMSRLSTLDVPGPNREPADSNQLWWRAQLLKKWEAERRARSPLDIVQPIEIAGGLIAAGLLLYWSLPYVL